MPAVPEVRHAPIVTSGTEHWKDRYGVSYSELEEALEFMGQTAQLREGGATTKMGGRHVVLVPEAFSGSVCEQATSRVIEDGLMLGGRLYDRPDPRSKEALIWLKDQIMAEGKLCVDNEDAIERLKDFRAVLGEVKVRKDHMKNGLIRYIHCDVCVAGERLKEKRQEHRHSMAAPHPGRMPN